VLGGFAFWDRGTGFFYFMKCFLLTPNGQARLSLRRYSQSDARPCVGNFAYHNAMKFYMDVPERKVTKPDGLFVYQHDGPETVEDLPAGIEWPTKCDECDFQFREEDYRQVFSETLYTQSDGDGITTASAAGPGAIYDAEWLHGNPDVCGPDGHAYIAICPDGAEWLIDGPSSSGGSWTRTGTPPQLTVRPSIQTAKYHGWLTNGEFVDA
jgi:hypothetical protein